MFIPIPVGEQYYIFPEGTSDEAIKEKIVLKRRLMPAVIGFLTTIIGLIVYMHVQPIFALENSL